jgi:metal-sulfur cluster biosynthetic enzyme
MEMKAKVIDILKTCYDPEIPVDLWNLGLIYDINLINDNEIFDINITMSLTTPGCSMGHIMANDIKEKLAPLKEIKNVNVEVTFDPPWKPEMMTEEARTKLGFDPVKSEKNKPKIDVEWE